MKRKKAPPCFACGKPASFEHEHLSGPSEFTCYEHWNGCKTCKRIRKGGDKYVHLARQGQ